MKSQTPGPGQAYLGGYTDAAGEWLDGGRDYTLHVPADPPASSSGRSPPTTPGPAA